MSGRQPVRQLWRILCLAGWAGIVVLWLRDLSRPPVAGGLRSSRLPAVDLCAPAPRAAARQPDFERQPAPARDHVQIKRLRPSRRLRRILGTAGFVGLIVVWGVFLRPQLLGGPAGYVAVSGTSMEPKMHTGDVVLVHRKRSYDVGDVIAFRIPAGQAGAGRVVIHRVTGGSAADGYVTRGDNRDSDDLWRPKPSDVVGSQRLRVPALGSIARMIISPPGLGLLAALATIVLMAPAPRRRKRVGRTGHSV